MPTELEPQESVTKSAFVLHTVAGSCIWRWIGEASAAEFGRRFHQTGDRHPASLADWRLDRSQRSQALLTERAPGNILGVIIAERAPGREEEIGEGFPQRGQFLAESHLMLPGAYEEWLTFSENGRFLEFPEDFSKDARHFPNRGVGLATLDKSRHDVPF
jgi:hypothetical protein